MQLQGAPGEGLSTGGAMTAITEMHGKLPPGTALEWTGLSYEERLSGGQAPALYALSLFVVFLCLAALYESWSEPISVLLVVPLGVIGAVFAAWIKIGRAHVCTPGTNEHLVCRLLLEKKK